MVGLFTWPRLDRLGSLAFGLGARAGSETKSHIVCRTSEKATVFASKSKLVAWAQFMSLA